ncbi:DUF1365 domain-containing protein [Coraliomargarita algicola]|uniref:DUF1365 domain-containing protein n=1 Tax=Coraliomargarita algicola TaxID=3092156 RepID=A0ABZ0RH20_9BACT|nr:DUF1365 domain-containing protein [Coraliomargarita sp. J2-16]WPJ94539.1 DUF1365 domain-containing protein [Coraliomargarita sp. J2-16]
MKRHSQLFRGTVTHQRLGPTPHAFSYPATFFCFNLAELPTLSQQATLLGHNQFRPLTIRDRDYLNGNSQSIEQQLDAYIPCQHATHTLLISSPRYFGYAFNPVNFHLRMQDQQLLAVVAEVNNTFGDRHIYPLTKLNQKSRYSWTATCPKDFHVSPFNNQHGEYHFTFRIERESISIGVDLYRNDEYIIKTSIQGKAKTLNNATIWRYALVRPFDTALNTMPRILWQAAQIYYRKKLQIYPRPTPNSPHTLINKDQKKETPPVV